MRPGRGLEAGDSVWMTHGWAKFAHYSDYPLTPCGVATFKNGAPRGLVIRWGSLNHDYIRLCRVCEKKGTP